MQKHDFLHCSHFRWLRKQNFGPVSCWKICFRWLMNIYGVHLSHRKVCFKNLIKIVITLYPDVLRLQCCPFGVSATCLGFGMAAASQAASGPKRLIATSSRVSCFWWYWGWGLEFLVCNLDSLIFLQSLTFSFLNLILLSSSLVFFPFISYRESYNSTFLLVNLSLVLLI